MTSKKNLITLTKLQPSLDSSSSSSESSCSSKQKQDNSAEDAFSALEKHVQTFQPSVISSTDQNNINGEVEVSQFNNGNSTSPTTTRKSVSFRTPKDSDTIFFKPRDTNIILTSSNHDDEEAEKSTKKKNSNNSLYSNDEDDEDDGVIMVSQPYQTTAAFDDQIQCNDDNDDDDGNFIIHDEDDETGRVPSAVAAALEHHEKKMRGVKTAVSSNSSAAKLKRKSNKNSGSEGDGSSSQGKNKNWFQKKMSQLIPKGGLISSAANLTASILGSSALIIAYCFERSAIIPGSVTLLVNAFFTVYTIWLLARMLDRLGEQSYEGIATRICGKTFGKSAALCVALFGWGCAAVYAAVLKSVFVPFVPALFPDSRDLDHQSGIVVSSIPMSVKEKLFPAMIGLVTQVPLSLKEEMNSLRFVSSLGTFSIITLVVSVVHHALVEDFTLVEHRISKRISVPTSAKDFLATIGIFVFSYCCQTNIFPVYEEMKTRTPYQMGLASFVAITVCTLFYIIVGVGGVGAFGVDVSDNIVENFIIDGAGSVDSILCCISVGLTVLGCFPVSLFPAREAILEASGYEGSRTVRMCLGIFMAVSALVVGIMSPGLVTICSIVGGAIGTWISYIVPVYLTYRHGELLDSNSPYYDLNHVIMCILVVIFGAGAGTLGCVMSVVHAMSN